MAEVAQIRGLDLGIARVSADGDGILLFEGSDDRGMPWRAQIPGSQTGGELDRIFRADYDANGRLDLLIVSMSTGNGRCINNALLTSLLFDEAGRPTPWQINTNGHRKEDPLPKPRLRGKVSRSRIWVEAGKFISFWARPL